MFGLFFICFFILLQEAIACGPFFPEQVLINRKATLTDEIVGDFDNDIHQLISKGTEKNFFTKNTIKDLTEEDREETPREYVDKQQLSAKQFTLLTLMKTAKNGDEAYAIGKKLPEAVKAYAAGAVAYHLDALPNAKTYFNKVLTQNDKTRTVWATYMLAKISAKQNQEANAKTGFQQVRKLVIKGYPDPLSLAVNSYGEEARLYYEALNYPHAFALYATQTSYDASAVESLKIALSSLINEKAEIIEHTLTDAFSRNLILLYAHTHLASHNDDKDYSYYSDERIENAKKKDKNETDFLANLIRKTLEQSEKDKIFQLKGAGWLAANRYARGDFALASQLVKFDKSALSQWVKAKLALRNGQLDKGYAALSQAIKHFPTPLDNTIGNTTRYKRLKAEYAILALERKDYQYALQLFYNVTDGWTYWGDAAHIAERVLTINELTIFVDQYTTPSTQAAIDTAKENYKIIPATALRAILARRLLRTGLLDKAINYFDDIPLRAIAQRYVNALHRANNTWRTTITRAEAWHEAAVIAKENGLEIMGFELAPDNVYLSGDYDEKEWELSVPFQANTFTSLDEQNRCNQSRAKPDLRFHYRLVAADYMLKAANLVPQSSQAFAAILCQATGWNLVRYPKQATKLYKKYVKEGAYVPWTHPFGRQCEAPNFTSATTRLWAEHYQKTKGQWRPYKYFIYSMIVALVFFIGWYGMKRIRTN